jgi:hypothetical protein
MDNFAIYKDPWILGMVLLLPVIIIGIAKTWKKFKDKRTEKDAAAAAAAAASTPSQPSS